ncbi:Nephrin [Chionoecetes opilio]|uniref:Nephrin n=1 Tax=Chionoecetes opilio TaxID=41210 RepID=A0A8J4YCQ7_CHIOP|nr:Nephrin [Chionoecetes opilio]
MLVDTGCSRSIAHVSCCKAWKKGIVSMTTVSGEEWQCEGTGIVRLQLSGGAFTTVRVSVTAVKPLGFEFILGMDGIKALDGVTVDARNGVRFGVEKSEFCAAANTVVAVDERLPDYQAGPYTCSASNVEGDARSAPLNLTVNYAPVCENPPSGEPLKVYAAGVGRAVNTSCRVLASPPSVRFSWVFNNSVSSERLSGDQVFTMADGGSVAQFRPKMNQELGTLQCWAENTVGRMTVPCIFQVVPAGRPEAPTSCSVVNKTYDSLVVTCAASFDGGLRQNFSARVFESVTGMGQVNVTSHLPHFTFDGLTPGLDYLIEVMAHNELGASKPRHPGSLHVQDGREQNE